jgi:hypothetical protein
MADPASLQNLNDIIEPAAVSFWPPAPGVWLVVALVLLWAVVGVALMGFRWRRNAYRREGMRALRRIRLEIHTPDQKTDQKMAALRHLSALLKRVALTAFPRETVAALSGDRWIAFLDASMAGGWLASPAGKLLADASYRPSAFAGEIPDRQIEELFNLAGQWIRRHRLSAPDVGGA